MKCALGGLLIKKSSNLVAAEKANDKVEAFEADMVGQFDKMITDIATKRKKTKTNTNSGCVGSWTCVWLALNWRTTLMQVKGVVDLIIVEAP